MGVVGLLKNISRRHDFNLEWKNRTPSADYIRKIGKALGWDLSTDLIVFEHDYGWDQFVGGAWKCREGTPQDAEFVEASEWQTLDQIALEELCEVEGFHTDPHETIRRCLIQP